MKTLGEKTVSVHVRLTDAAALLMRIDQDLPFTVLMALETRAVLKPFLTVNRTRIIFQ